MKIKYEAKRIRHQITAYAKRHPRISCEAGMKMNGMLEFLAWASEKIPDAYVRDGSALAAFFLMRDDGEMKRN